MIKRRDTHTIPVLSLTRLKDKRRDTHTIPELSGFFVCFFVVVAASQTCYIPDWYDLLLYCFWAAFLVKRSTTHTKPGSLKCSQRSGSHTNSILMQITEVSKIDLLLYMC